MVVFRETKSKASGTEKRTVEKFYVSAQSVASETKIEKEIQRQTVAYQPHHAE